ncbi:unnamed protein product [Paramecium pentaurelia]|uniref:Transmembrane protein n=1 Tax=Paramecium pentaurelia TaxID=43138 RepID=A0A8S1XMH9_9CILI|nr:unnamed protein product [Paramecium pentaurelia]
MDIDHTKTIRMIKLEFHLKRLKILELIMINIILWILKYLAILLIVKQSKDYGKDIGLYFGQSLCDLKEKCFIKYDQGYLVDEQEKKEKQQIKEAQKFSVELAGALLSETVKQILFQ